jgi:DNA-binding transcriptional regulator GbsR (MarR family)
MPERHIQATDNENSEETAPDDIEDPYAEDTPLTWVFGNHSKVRIIAALLSESDRDLNITNIARIAGISRSAVYDNIEDLLEWDIVENTRPMGSGQLYKINQDNKTVQLIAQVEEQLLDDFYNQKD